MPDGWSPAIVLVDDHSEAAHRAALDELVATLRSEDRHLEVRGHDHNRGKGAAVRTGFDAILAAGPPDDDLVIIQDADLEYDPNEFLTVIGPILDGRADVVYGTRFRGGPHRVHFFWHYVANMSLTLLSNMLSDLDLTDMETCYKRFRREVLQGVELKSDRFGFEPEITAKVAKGGWRVYEVPISYSGRDYSEGKKITWRDGIAALWHILRFNLFG